MDRISNVLHQLKKINSGVRKDARQQFRWEQKLSEEAVSTLKQATPGPDPHVVKATGRAFHDQKNMLFPSTDESVSHDPGPEYPWSWVGELHPAQVLYLVLVTGFFIMSLSDDWRVSLFILLFLVGCFFLTGLAERPRHQKLIEVWSALARQTGLHVDPGHSYFFGESIPPRINGIYRGRHISINKQVQWMSGYESDIPVVYTCMQLEVKNTANWSFSMVSRSWRERLFKSRTAGSGDSYFDKHFSFIGKPPKFVRRACALIVSHPRLLDHPDGVIMLTDYPLSWTNWRRPTVELKANELVCLQSGISTDVPGQVEILNLLCDLAELAENMAHLESNL